MQHLIDEQRDAIEQIQQALIAIEERVDGFVLKHSIEEKLLQKEDLKVNGSLRRKHPAFSVLLQQFSEACLQCDQRLEQIHAVLVVEHIDDGQLLLITNESKRKCDELRRLIQVSELCRRINYSAKTLRVRP